jgi:hypothetical protein
MAVIPTVHQQQQPDDPIVLFQAADGQVSLDVRLEADTVWLSQAQMAQLFGRERSVISKHIGNVFKEGELESISTCAKFAQVQTEGSWLIQRHVDFYNLDVIISVGYGSSRPVDRRKRTPTERPDDPGACSFPRGCRKGCASWRKATGAASASWCPAPSWLSLSSGRKHNAPVYQAQMAEPPCPIPFLHTRHASRSTASPTACESFPSRLSSR